MMPASLRDGTTSRVRSRRAALCCTGFVLCLVGGPAAQQPQTPVFRSSVEVTSLDVGVVDRDGKPMTGLTPADFTVQVDGSPRRVVTAEWVSLVTPAGPEAPPPPPGFSTNEGTTGGRLILIVIDQPNIRFGGALGLRRAVNAFIDRLQPSDRIAAVGIGPGSNSTPFTNDRERVKQAIARMPGSRSTPPAFDVNVSVSEALAIRSGDGFITERVLRRECGEPAPNGTFTVDQELCRVHVEATALTIAQNGVADSDVTIGQLRALLMALRAIDLPKTMLIVTEGFLTDDQQPSMVELGNLALEARTSIYALKLEDELFDIARATAPTTPFADRMARSEGIEIVTGAARGTLFNIGVGAEAAFARIESELSGYYLIGVESDPADKDGKRHPIKVSVNRPGASVRSRRQLMTPPGGDVARSPREAAMSALASPLNVSGLPMRVATFSLRGPDPTKIQLLIHAAVGSGYTSSKVVSFGYVISDAEGRIIESLAGDARLPPVMNGVPSALQYNMGSSIPPGDYTLKIAVAEGDRVGTVEHPIHARLVDASPVVLSELMVGGPIVAGRAPDRPTIGHEVAFGGVHGYIEAYGAGSNDLKARYEIAPDEESPAVLSADVPARPAGPERTIFSDVVMVRQLPPGKYVLRATVSSEAGALKTVTRDFVVSPPPVLMTTAADGGSSPIASAELYLPVIETQLARAFKREDAMRPEILREFRERLGDESRAVFDSGVASLSQGDYQKAETTLKTLAQGDSDSTAVLAYLAATFASSGHDQEAASAWQTALIDGSDVPEIYEWLADALMRLHDLGQARMILEEAVGKWPTDNRFAKPLAVMYATFGQGREAVRTLQRHLSAHPDDIDATYMCLEWLYHLHLAGAAAQNRAEDIKVARTYAARYEKARGPQLPLVKQWMDYLEGRRR
jgi:VWFA-related protein